MDSARETASPNDQDALTLQKLLSPIEASIQEVYLPGSSTPSLASNASVVFSTTYPSNYFTFFSVLKHPFSRRSVHITSSSPFDYPAVDPNYQAHPLDAYVIGQGLLHIQQVAQIAPLSNDLKNGGTVYQPELYELNDDIVEQFVRNAASSEHRPMGSCSMRPRDKGGDVNERLKVHGTENMRVMRVFFLWLSGAITKV